MAMKIPLFKVFMGPDIGSQVTETLLSGFVTQGPRVEELETELKSKFDHPHLLTLSSATAGLSLAMRLLINPDPKRDWPGFNVEEDLVLTPALTCFATTCGILANGCKLRWLDADPATMNASLDDIRAKLSPRTKVIYVVHWGGYPLDLDGLKDIQDEAFERFGFRPQIIEDCAHAFGATYKGKSLGSHGNICVFSLQAIKHFTTGDGGIITLPTETLYKRAKLLRWFGIDRDKRNYKGKDLRLENDIPEYGYKFHMNDINARIGLVNLPHIDDLLAKHRTNMRFLRKALADCPGVLGFQEDAENRDSAAWICSLRVERKPAFMTMMKEAGVQVSQIHNRNDVHSCVADFQEDLPLLTELEKTLVCIPCGWWCTSEDLDYLVSLFRRGW